MFSYYGKLSTELYDFTKPIGHSLDGDIEYYMERLSGCEGKILEAGVGSGRLFIPFLEAGFKIEGIDNSKEMLASCRRSCEERGLYPELYEGNLQKFSLPASYDAIILPTGSFSLLENREDSLAALDSFYHHLNPGGRLILDLFLPGNFIAGERTLSAFTLPDGDGITLERNSVEIDWLNQKTVTYLKYEKWREGRLIDTELQKFSLRWYGVEEFKLVLEKAGFTGITCSSNYKYGQEPTVADQMLTFEAVKKD
ncbi:class I SAM-dependent methyltransferase [Jeotgalibacillus proteolyticus]|uniref:Class I SAM-dependent methyltransferase n=1 Tax=Jeotgalibacillus proteolyticus TaxID=2082395 RepID=A0A2S5GDJ9_9BACL|nr:class I SAM-dependent methyltransferase [Jeotgalibacillus proteolyticus]PPA70984.1 class I SAM-dependent methyltransferase [Jeotgalibacillus proteolyticus]